MKPNVFNQNILQQAENIRRHNRFSLPAGDASISFIDVVDIAGAVKSILTHDGHTGKTYDLTGPEALSFFDVARILSDVTKKPIEYEPITFEESVLRNEEPGLSKWEARKRAETQSGFATGIFAPIIDDLSDLLGRPPTHFKTFAEAHKDYFC